MRDADGRARELLETLFASESEEDLRLGFDDLSSEMRWRREEHERMEAEAMKQARKGRGGSRSRPRPTRRVSQSALEEAAAVWGGATDSGADSSEQPV
jgi:hypothetical protein